MAMTAAYFNALRTEGKTLITHIGLVDETDTELTGGSPAYARKAVTWADGADGVMSPNADLDFDVPASTTVGGWRGYSASTAGTDYGGEDLTQEAFAGQGEYTLLASATSVTHQAAA
jgi:hypothetical protein